MKRTLIIAVLCMLLVTTVGVTTAAGAQQKGKSPVYQFDVTLYGKQTVVGKLIVNTDTQTFVFNGKGLTPNREYLLVCKDTGRLAGQERTTNAGTVHMEGAWKASVARLFAHPTFALSDVPPTGSGSGDLFATTLTLAIGKPYVWIYDVNYYGYKAIATGTLKDGNGAGIGYAPITVTSLRTRDGWGTWTVSYSTTTLPDGTFSVEVWRWWISGSALYDDSNYQAHFAGDSVYQASDSTVVPTVPY